MEKNDLVKFRSECLSAHNFYRSLHGTTPLIWSSKLAEGAQKWAEQLASADSLTYSHERGVGENIACLWGSDVTGNKVTQIWYEESKHYNYTVPRVTPITRPFCQVIWEGCRELGAGKSATKNGKQIVVARYSPPASRRNAERNVKKPRLDRVDGDSCLVPHSLGLRKFQEECLFAHNEFRVLHGSPPLHWSPSLAWAAQQWAEELVRMGELKHNDDEMVGENLAGMVGDELTGKECTDMWYDEVSDYDYDCPGYSEDTSNFTQVVWIGSELFGVGRATYGDLCVVVAFYEPPGNMECFFAENVRKAGTRVKSYRLIKETKTFIPPSPDLDWFRIECLVAHNYFRARHGATPLVIAHGLNEEAQYWAERLLVTGATEDLQESRIGINVAVIEGQHVSGLKVVELWYQESTNYDFNSPGFKLDTRSFTQLLWLTSRKLGVGKACNDNGQCVVVARYEPVGNIDGLFVSNVRKRGHERNAIEPALFETDVKYRFKVDGRRSLRMSWEVEGAMLQAENKHHDQTRRKEQAQPAYMSSPETFTRLVWIESPVLPRRRMRPESSDLEKEDLDKSDEDKESGVEEGEEFDNEEPLFTVVHATEQAKIETCFERALVYVEPKRTESSPDVRRSLSLDSQGTEPEPEDGRVLSRIAYFEQFEKMEEKPKRSSVELKPGVKKTVEHEETVCQLEYDDVFPKHDENDERDDDFASEEEAEDEDDDGMSLETVSEADEDLLGELDEFEMDHHIKSYCYEENYVRDEDNVVDETNREETQNRELSPDHCYAVSVKREEAAEEHLKNVDHIFEFIPREVEKQHKDVDLKKVDLAETKEEQELFKFETSTDKPRSYSGPLCTEEVQETHHEKQEHGLDMEDMVTRLDEKPKPPPTLPKPQRNKQEITNEPVETNKVIYTEKATDNVPETVEEKYVNVVQQKEEFSKEDKVIYTEKTEKPVEEEYSTVVKQKDDAPQETELIASSDEDEDIGEAMEVIDISHIDRDRRVDKILNRLRRHIELIPCEQSPKKGVISRDIDLTETEDEKAIFDLYTPSSETRSWSTSPVEEEMITAEEKLKVESEIPWEELFKDEDESSEKEDKVLQSVARIPPEKRRSVSFKETVIIQEHEAVREEPLQDEYEYCEEESEEDLKTYGEEFEDPFEAKTEGVQEQSAGSPVFVSHEVDVEDTTEVVADERDNEEENAETFEEEDALKVDTAVEDNAQSISLSEELSEDEDKCGVDEQQTEDSVADVYEEYETSHGKIVDGNSSSFPVHVAAEVERNEPVDTGLLEEESAKTTVCESFEEIRPRSSSTEVVVPSSCHVTAEIEIHESEVRPVKEVEVDTLSEEEPESDDNVVVRGIPESSESTVCITTETTYHHNTEIVYKRAPSVEVDTYNEEELQTEEPSFKEVLPNGHCTSTYITRDVEVTTLEETVESEKEECLEETPEVIDEPEVSVEELQRKEDDDELEDEPLSEEELLEDENEEEEKLETETVEEKEQTEMLEKYNEEEQEPHSEDEAIELETEKVEEKEQTEKVESQEEPEEYNEEEPQIEQAEETCVPVNESRVETEHETIELEDGGLVSKSVTREETSTVLEDDDDNSSVAKKIITKTIVTTTTTSRTFTNDEEEQEPHSEDDEESIELETEKVEEKEQTEILESQEEPEKYNEEEQEPHREEDDEAIELETEKVEEEEQNEMLESQEEPDEYKDEERKPHIEEAEETCVPVNESRVETEHETIELEDGGLVSKSVTREEISPVDEDDDDNSSVAKKIISKTIITTTTTSRTFTNDEEEQEPHSEDDDEAMELETEKLEEKEQTEILESQEEPEEYKEEEQEPHREEDDEAIELETEKVEEEEQIEILESQEEPEEYNEEEQEPHREEDDEAMELETEKVEEEEQNEMLESQEEPEGYNEEDEKPQIKEAEETCVPVNESHVETEHETIELEDGGLVSKSVTREETSTVLEDDDDNSSVAKKIITKTIVTTTTTSRTFTNDEEEQEPHSEDDEESIELETEKVEEKEQTEILESQEEPEKYNEEEQEPHREEDDEAIELETEKVEEEEQIEMLESQEEPEEYNEEEQEPQIEETEETCVPVNESRVETEHETIELEDGGLVSKSITREEISTVEEDDDDDSLVTKKIITKTFTTTTTTRTFRSDDDVQDLSREDDVLVHEIPEQEDEPPSEQTESDRAIEETVQTNESQQLELEQESVEEEVTEEDARETVVEATYQKTETRVVMVGRPDNFYFHEVTTPEEDPISINIQENKDIEQSDEHYEDKEQKVVQVSDEEKNPTREEEIDDNKLEKSAEEEDEHLLQPKIPDDRIGYISEEELEETEELYITLRESSEEQEYEEKVDVENVYIQQTVPGVIHTINQEDEKFEPSEDDIAYDSEVITEVEKEITSALVVKESFSCPIYDDGEAKTEEQPSDPLHPVEFDDAENIDESIDIDEEEMLEKSPESIEENEDVESSDENVADEVQLVQFTEETEVKEDLAYEGPKDDSREPSPTRSFEEEEEDEREEDEEELESSGELMEENVELIQFSEPTEPFEQAASPSPSDDEEKEIESSEENVDESVELIQFSEQDTKEDIGEEGRDAESSEEVEEERDAESSEEIVEESVELIQFSETSEEEKIVEFDNSKEEFVEESEAKTVQLIQFTEQDEEKADKGDSEIIDEDESEEAQTFPPCAIVEAEKREEEPTKEEAVLIHLSEERIEIEEQITREEKCIAPCIPIVLTESSKTEQHEEAELYMLKDAKDGDFMVIMDAPLACSTPIDIADAKSDDTFEDSGEAGFGEGYDVIERIIAHDDSDELQRSLDVSHEDSLHYVEAEEVATKAVAEAEDLDDSLQSPRPQKVEEHVIETEQEKAELVDLSVLESDKDKEFESSEDHVSPPPTIFATEFVAEEEEEGSDEEYIPHFDHPRIYMVEEKELVIDPSTSESQASDTIDSSFRTDFTTDTEYPSEISTASEFSQAIDNDRAQIEMETSHSTIVQSPTSDLDELEEEDKERIHRRQEKMEEVFLQEEIDVQNSQLEEEEPEKREEKKSQVSYASSFSFSSSSVTTTRHEVQEDQHHREEQATVIMQEDEKKLYDKEPKQEDIAADEAMTEDDFRSDGHSSKSDESFDDLDGTQEESKTLTESVYQEELDVSKVEPSYEEDVSEAQESAPINVDIDFTEEVEVERVPEVEEAPKSLDEHEKVEQYEDEQDVFQEEVEIQRVEDNADEDVFEEEVEIKRMEDRDEQETHHVHEETSVVAVFEEELEIATEQREEDEPIEENHGVLLAEPIQSDDDGEREHTSEEDIIRAEEIQQEAEESDSPESDQQRHLEEYEIEEEDQAIPHEMQGTNEHDNIYDNNNNQSMTRYYVDYSPGASFERDSTASDEGEYPEVYRQGEPMEEDMEEFILVKYGDGHSHSDSSEEEDLSDHREMYVIPEEDSEERVHHNDGEQESKQEPDETVFYEQGFMNPALEDINEEEEDDDKEKDSPKDDEDDIEEKLQLEEYERLESFVILEEKLSQVESDGSMEDLTGGNGEKRASSDETLNDDDELADTTNTSSTLKDEVPSKESSGEESSGELEKTLTTEEEEIIDLDDGGVLSKRTTREESYSVEEMNDESDGDDDKDKTLTRKRVSKKIITTTTTSATHVKKVPSEDYHSSDEEEDGGKEELSPALEASKDEEPTKPENTSSTETKQETIELDDGGVVSKSVTREETCTYDDGDHGDDSWVTQKTLTRKIVTTTTTTASKSTPLSEPALCLTGDDNSNKIEESTSESTPLRDTTLCSTEEDENSNKIEESISSQPHETVIKSRQNGEELVDQSAKRQLSREGSFAEASVEPLTKRRGFSIEGFDSHDSEGHSSTTDSTGESTGRSYEDLISDEDYSGLDDFQRDCIRQHNIYRHQHRACRLVWSEELCNAAGAWAEHLAATNTLEHSSDKDHGENLASAKGYELRGDKVAEMWYDEVKDYNFEIPAFNAKCGHFTQMIWRETKQLGVAKCTAADGTQYVVARYYPPGNVLGEFKTSIRRARGQRSSVRKRRRSSARRKTSQTDSGDVITQQEKFKNECIVSHNYYRSLHGAEPLQWSTRLAIESQNFAEKLVRSGSFMHSGDREIGECLAFSFGLELSGRDAIDSWYDEIVDYDYEFPGFTSHTANFTQLVWQGTKEFGVGKAIGEDGSCVVVGRYYPPGNQVGNFQDNVKQKQPGYF